MKKVAVLFLIALGLSSCRTPGMNEPEIFVCTIEDDKSLYCVHTSEEKDAELSVVDAIGYQCVSPKAFGIMKTHHEALHRALNEKRR